MAPKTIYSAGYRHLVQRLRARREELGITQSALSVQLGWPQQRLSAIEAGARRLDVMEFLHLTSSLEVSPGEAIEMALQAYAATPRMAKQRGKAAEEGGRRG